MGNSGNRRFASGLASFRMAGAGSADVRAVQRARSRIRRSSRILSWILGMVVLVIRSVWPSGTMICLLAPTRFLAVLDLLQSNGWSNSSRIQGITGRLLCTFIQPISIFAGLTSWERLALTSGHPRFRVSKNKLQGLLTAS